MTQIFYKRPPLLDKQHSISATFRTFATIAFSLSLILFASEAFAEATASLSVDPSVIPLSDTATITLDLSYDGSENPTFERQPDLTPLRVINSSSMPTYMNINGKESRRIQVQYIVKADKTGVYPVNFPPIRVGGKRLIIKPKSLKVVESPSDARPSSGPVNQALGTDTDNYSLDVSIEPQRNPYVGEQVLLTYVFNRRFSSPSVQLSMPTTPDFDHFWVETFDQDPESSRRTIRTKRGVVEQITIDHFAVFPLNVGRATIDPMTIVVTQTSFFSRGPQREISSRGIDLNVQPLPPNAPTGFMAPNVGQYKFSVSASPLKSKVGLPTNITLKVTGDGYIDRAALPQLPDLPNTNLSNKEEKTLRDPSVERVVGSKIITYTLIPTKKGTLQIPPLTFVYFDPDKATYQTITSKPISIDIADGVLPQALNNELQNKSEHITPEEIAEKEDEPLIQDIVQDLLPPIDIKNAVPPSKSPFQTWWFYLLAVIPIIGMILLVGIPRLMQRIEKRRLQSFDKKASTRLKIQLEQAKTWSKVHEIIREVFVKMLNLSPGQITSDTIANPLKEKGFSPQFIDDTIELLKRLEIARFSQKLSTDPPEDIKKAIESIINNAHAESLPKRSRRSLFLSLFGLITTTFIGALTAIALLTTTATFSSTAYATENSNRTPPFPSPNELELSVQVADKLTKEAITAYNAHDYKKAAQLWQESLLHCPNNATILYDLATAEARQFQLGKARLHIEEAAMVAPLDSTIMEQRTLIRRMVRRRSIEHSSDGETLSGDEPLFWWHFATQISPHLLATLILIGLWLAFLACVVRKVTKHTLLRDIALITFIVGIGISTISTGIYIARVIVLSEVRPAVLMDSKVDFRSGPTQYAPLEKMPENAIPGTLLRIEAEQGKWLKVVFPNGSRGWTNSGVSEVRPSE